MTWACVVPSNRPARLTEFQDAWADLFATHNVTLYVVEDKQATWDLMPEWMPRRTDQIRSYGFWQAWQAGHTYTVTLDDDVRPTRDIFQAYEQVFEAGLPFSDYLDVGALTTSGAQMRGYPHQQREPRVVAVQYGGWTGIPDYDARTQLALTELEADFYPIVLPVPAGCAVTGSAMNMAFRTEHTPIMWQLPLLEGRYNRYGDIWGALLTKKACDAAGFVVAVNGRAQVRHDRASDPQRNLEIEARGEQVNEELWGALDGGIAWPDPVDAYRTVLSRAVTFFHGHDTAYAQHLDACGVSWLDLFR